MRLSVAPQAGESTDLIAIQATVAVEGIAVGKMKLLAMLPRGYDYIVESATVDGDALVEPSVAEGVLSFTLGESAAALERHVSFTVRRSTTLAADSTLRSLVLFDSPTQTAQTSPFACLALSSSCVSANDSASTKQTASRAPSHVVDAALRNRCIVRLRCMSKL